MKLKVFFAVFIFLSISTVNGQTGIIADSLHCSFFNDTSKVNCDNGDTVFIDLDNDDTTDLKVWKYEYTESCFHSFWQYNNSGWISIQSSENFRVLYADLLTFTPAKKVNYADTIDTGMFGPVQTLYLYYNSMLGYHCQVVELGWGKNTAGFIAVRKILSYDTTYYLVKIRVSNDAHCFQVIRPDDNTVVNTFEQQAEYFKISKTSQKIVISGMSPREPGNIFLYDAVGNMVLQENINKDRQEIDISYFNKGLYVIFVVQKSHTGMFKIIR